MLDTPERMMLLFIATIAFPDNTIDLIEIFELIMTLLEVGMITSLMEVGIPTGFQLAATLKELPFAPTQVLVCAEVVIQKKHRMTKCISDFIIQLFKGYTLT